MVRKGEERQEVWEKKKPDMNFPETSRVRSGQEVLGGQFCTRKLR